MPFTADETQFLQGLNITPSSRLNFFDPQATATAIAVKFRDKERELRDKIQQLRDFVASKDLPTGTEAVAALEGAIPEVAPLANNASERDARVFKDDTEPKIQRVVELKTKVGKAIVYFKELAKANDLLLQLRNLGLPTPVDEPLAQVIYWQTIDSNYLEVTYTVQTAALKSEAKGVYEAQVQKAGQVKNAAVNNARFEVLYKDADERIGVCITQMEALAGTQAARDKLAQMRTQAATHLPANGAKDYAQAYEAIKTWEAEFQKGLDAATTFRTNGGAAFFLARNSAAIQVNQFAELADIARPTEVGQYRKRIADADREVAAGSDDGPLLAAKLNEMTQLASECQRLVHTLTVAKLDADDARTPLAELDRQFKAVAPTAVYAEYHNRYLAACAILNAQQYREALNEFNTLLGELNREISEYSESHTTWSERVAGIQAALDGIAGSGAIPQAAEQTRKRLSREFNVLTLEIGTSQDYASGNPRAAAILLQLTTMRNTLGSNQSDAPLQEAEQQRNALAQRITEAIADLHSRELPNVAALFEDAFKKLGSLQQADSWPNVVNSFYTLELGDWQAAKNRCLQAHGDLLARLNHERDELRANPELENQKKREAALQKVQYEIPAALREADSLLQLLHAEATAGDDADKIKGASDRLVMVNQIKGKAPNTWTESDLENIQQYTNEAKLALQQLAAAIATKISELQQRIETARQSLNNLGHNTALRARVAEVRDELLDCEGLVEGRQMAAVAIAKKKMDAIEPIIAKMQEESGAAPPAPAVPPATQQLVAQRIDALKKQIDTDVLEECLPARHSVFKYRIAELPKECAEVPAADAIENLIEPFEKEVVTAIETANERQKDRTKIKQDAQEQENRLKPFAAELQRMAPKVYQDLTSRLAAVKTRTQENSELGARQDLATITKLIDWVTTPDKDPAGQEIPGKYSKRQDLEHQHNQAQLDAELAKSAWGADREVFHREQAEVKAKYDAATQEGGADEELYQQIATLAQEADAAAKAQKYEEAGNKLKEARVVVKEFLRYPYNIQVTGSKKLKQAADYWKQAVGGYLASLTRIRADLTQKTTDEAMAEQGKAALKVLAPIGQLFDANAFDNAVTVLGDRNAERADRRQVKEEALRQLRNYRKTLEANKILLHLQEYPAGGLQTANLRRVLQQLDPLLLAKD